ncbi:MAG: hypothetical protein KJ561_05975 [Nanoarchaeota archaeon]|nr:hypothetical protein [Nanoarchaeota archaeon]
MESKTEKRIELFLLLIIVILQVMDFLGLLSGDADFAKKILSWVGFGYIFIKASLSTMLFGNKKPKFDLIIILSYFLLTIKDLVKAASVGLEEVHLLEETYIFIVNNSAIIEKYSFYLGAIIILFLALRAALKFEIKRPSLMAVLHETGKPSKKTFIIRFLSIFTVLVAFFIIVFNMCTEWLAVALDAPLAVIGIFFYLFVIVRYHKHLSPNNIIHKIGSFGEEFYEKFIEMFHSKKGLSLGIMGLLALHLLTDVGHFIIPYITTLKSTFYFGHLGTGHDPLFYLFLEDMKSSRGIELIALITAYILNLIAMLFLLILPTFVWYRFFKKKLLHVSKTTLALVFSSLLCFLLTPAFFIKRITGSALAGVDLQTKSILSSSSFINWIIPDRITSIIIVAALAITLGIITWLLEHNKKIEKDMFIIAVIIGLSFFGFYIYYYFMSLCSYYIQTIIYLATSKEILLLLYFALFALTTIAFYIGGYIFFIYEIFKKHWFRISDKYLK